MSKSVVRLDIKENNLEGYWDPIRIEQALSNLILNALKYSPKSDISINVERSDSYVHISIKDKGKGIDEKYHKTIFEPFQRANNDNHIEGLGVGLFIAKQIALSHDGDISLVSIPGKGSTFTLKLPLI